MAKSRVSPNRMELMRLQDRVKLARRGYKLLKDKSDGMMRVFMQHIERTVRLRQEVDRLLGQATEAMARAQAAMGSKNLAEALLLSTEPLKVKVTEENVMSLAIPQFEISYKEITDDKGFPYSLASTTYELDRAISMLEDAFPAILKLASAEKEMQMLAQEIETTRRRVNSLEHFMIPEMDAQIAEISMRLEENARDNTTRLMKVKDELIEEQQAENKKDTETKIKEFKEKYF